MPDLLYGRLQLFQLLRPSRYNDYYISKLGIFAIYFLIHTSIGPSTNTLTMRDSFCTNRERDLSLHLFLSCAKSVSRFMYIFCKINGCELR